MSNEMIFFSVLVLLVLVFVFYCLIVRFRDAVFAFLNLFRHKRRTVSTLSAIILGGGAIFLYGGFINYSFWILKEQTIRTNVGHVQIYSESYFDTANKNKSLIANYNALKKAVMDSPELASHISTLSGQLEFTGIISQYENETSSYFAALGVEPVPALKLGAFDKTLYGSDLSQIKQREITLGSGLAKTLNAHYGDWLDVLVVNTSGGQGAVSLKLRGVFESGIKDYDDVAMKIPLETAQHIMGTSGVSKVLILLKDDDLASFVPKLKRIIADNKLPLIVRDWKEASVFYQQVESMLSGIYFFIKLIVALVVVFMISNAMTMNVAERTREITTLRAIGLKQSHIMRIFLLEGVYTGVLGAIGSLLVGYVLAALINMYGIPMPPSPGQSVGYTAFIKSDNVELIWITLVLPVLTAAAASILPAYRASRLNISDAFKFS